MRKLAELMNLNDRLCLITGGAGHIGLAFASALAELGANVVLVDKDQDRGARAMAALPSNMKSQYEVMCVDLAQEEEILNLGKTVRTKYGRLDILINNAAFVGTTHLKGWTVPFEDQTLETWRMAMDVNLAAAFKLVQVFAELLKRGGTGSVINVSSMYGLVGPDMRLYQSTSMGSPAAYAASKGGLIALTRWLSTVLAPRVRVNCIIPGGLFREQPTAFVEKYVSRTPLGRMGTEEDLKGAVAYLATDLSAYVTGQNLIVDGGWTAW